MKGDEGLPGSDGPPGSSGPPVRCLPSTPLLSIDLFSVFGREHKVILAPEVLMVRKENKVLEETRVRQEHVEILEIQVPMVHWVILVPLDPKDSE